MLDRVVTRVRRRFRRKVPRQQQPPDLRRWSDFNTPFPPVSPGGYRRYYDTHGYGSGSSSSALSVSSPANTSPESAEGSGSDCLNSSPASSASSCFSPGANGGHARNMSVSSFASTSASSLSGKHPTPILIPISIPSTPTGSSQSPASHSFTSSLSECSASPSSPTPTPRPAHSVSTRKKKRVLSAIPEGLSETNSISSLKNLKLGSSQESMEHLEPVAQSRAAPASPSNSLRRRRRRLLRTPSVEKSFPSPAKSKAKPSLGTIFGSEMGLSLQGMLQEEGRMRDQGDVACLAGARLRGAGLVGTADGDGDDADDVVIAEHAPPGLTPPTEPISLPRAPRLDLLKHQSGETAAPARPQKNPERPRRVRPPSDVDVDVDDDDTASFCTAKSGFSDD